MTDSVSSPELYLNAQEKHAYRELFKLADVEQKSFLAKHEAMPFFSNAGIPSAFLEEIWQTADEEGKSYITESEFYIALKLIACAQNGVEASEDNILSTRVSLPQFRGITISNKLTVIEPITAIEREKYIFIFESCHLVDGLLHGDGARNIFVKSRLSYDKLNAVWLLADTRKSGMLNKTEFIIAMHYISRLMANPALTLPTTLPSQTYAEATGRFASSIRRHNTTMASPIARNRSISNASSFAAAASPVMTHMTASSNSFSANTGLGNSLISVSGYPHQQVILSSEEIEQYKPYFYELDTDGSGFIESEEAVYFFSHSRLPDYELGIIWEIADARHLGRLDLHEFSVAMHLINMCKNGESIDKYNHTAMIQPQPQTQHDYPSSPAIATNQQLQAVDLSYQYELENQLVELKQQVNSQSKSLETYQLEYQEEKNAVNALEIQVSNAKNELQEAKKLAEEAEKSLELEQQKRQQLLGVAVSRSSATSTESNTPELTRAPSSLTNVSSIMSPPPSTATFDPFAGFKKSQEATTSSPRIEQKKMPLSPVQAKAVSKYGFDITAFDALSLSNNSAAKPTSSSFNDDLASIFGSPTLPTKDITKSATTTSSNFDSIFM